MLEFRNFSVAQEPESPFLSLKPGSFTSGKLRPGIFQPYRGNQGTPGAWRSPDWEHWDHHCSCPISLLGFVMSSFCHVHVQALGIFPLLFQRREISTQFLSLRGFGNYYFLCITLLRSGKLSSRKAAGRSELCCAPVSLLPRKWNPDFPT